MPPTLKIVQTGDPVLRQVAAPVPPEQIASPRIQGLIAMMRETMRDAPGVGLAAPQIGEPLRLVVIEDPPQLQAGLTPEQLAERERAAVPFHVLVNPTLTIIDPGNEVEAFEGCLSFKDFVMIVPRARTVEVEAFDERGTKFKKTASGWYARILQHEVDHLNGVVCCDRMDSRTLMTVDNHARNWRGHTIDEVRAALNAPRGGAR